MENEGTSRRLFLTRSLSGVASAWLATCWPAIMAAQAHLHQATQANAPFRFEFLSHEDAAEIDAITAQIIPTDGTPGAREARVTYFIDRALATFDSDRRELYAEGLKELQAQARQLFPAAPRFSALSGEQQIEVLKTIDKTEFFETVRIHTVVGFLADPGYGGNQGEVGWKLIGFENRSSFEPPFGFYDREYLNENK
jgi:gluconate 2-dehydrogenase gamma chain